MIWVASAIIFVVVLFCLKNKNLFTNTIRYIGGDQQTGLVYGDETVADLVNKSTTGDGIPDWKKILFGLDPTKAENVPGVPDSVTIAKLEAEANSTAPAGSSSDTNLTQTDKFSREFLATVTTLAQNGAIDANGNMNQATADQITNTLEKNVANAPQRKTYAISDINVVNDNSGAAVKTYNTDLSNLSLKNPTKESVTDILQKFAPDASGNGTDPAVLSELDPIIKQMTVFRDGLLTIPVPQFLVTLHLYMINQMEGMIENLSDVQQYNTDPLVAFSGMSQYEQNSNLFTETTQYIAALIDMKLSMK